MSSQIGSSNWKLNFGMVYIGNKRQLYQTIKILLDKKENYTVIQVKGIGKTRFLNEVCKYVNLRGRFKDGIFYFDLKKVVEIDQIRSLL